jgi:SAM-dependent methyltransferase
MLSNVEEIRKALSSLEYFKKYAVSPHHERYSFPFLRGTYFAYRRIDIIRVFYIANSISDNPSFIDVGCGYGDFLKKVREFIPNAIGIEKNSKIFYEYGIDKPDYIRIWDAKWGIDKKYDIIFVGWMEPGVDFRDAVANKADVIITTLDQGTSLAAEFDGHNYHLVAMWRTPSWEDVNIEIMNRYYTKMSDDTYRHLHKLRGAHNLWYVYCTKSSKKIEEVRSALLQCIKEEERFLSECYDFEHVLDECGFGYMQELEDFNSTNTWEKKDIKLWNIVFNNI